MSRPVLRAIGQWLLHHESRIFAVALGLLGLDLWRTLVLDIDRFAVYLKHGIYQTPLLSLLVTGLSALYMTVIVAILWTAKPPQARYETLLPNALAVLAGFGIYAFGLLQPASPRWLGIAWPLTLMAAGVGLVLWSLLYLRRAFSVVPQARRVERRGPYRWVRHPMYAGNILTIAGLALLLGTGAAFALAATMMVLQVCRAYYEDRLLAATFDEYRTYMNEVNAFLPRLRRPGGASMLLALGACLAATPAIDALAQTFSPADKAKLSQLCAAMHKQALAGQWLTSDSVDQFRMLDDGSNADKLPACKSFVTLVDRCNEPLFRRVSADPGTPVKPGKEFMQANAAMIKAIEGTPGCKSVMGFTEVCDAVVVHAKTVKTLSPGLKATLSSCADEKIGQGTSGLIRGAL